MIAPMEIILVSRTGKRTMFTLPTPEPVTSEWLGALCEKVWGKVGPTYMPVDMPPPGCPESEAP